MITAQAQLKMKALMSHSNLPSSANDGSSCQDVASCHDTVCGDSNSLLAFGSDGKLGQRVDGQQSTTASHGGPVH